MSMFGKALKKLSLKENRRRYLILKGIASKWHAYKGPDIVQIDLTDRCNSHCLICWNHSPFLKQNKNTTFDELDFASLKYFINDVKKSGTKEIIFSGGGEPFLYPLIWEALRFTQNLNLTFRINTNLTLLNQEDIARLLSLKNLASLTVSVWAGNAGLYSKIHNRDKDTFYKVKNNLRFLNDIKSKGLEVKIYSVINNMNYLELRSLLNLAAEAGCDAIEFGTSDIIPEVTDPLLLSEEQLAFLRRDFINAIKEFKGGKVKIINKNIFLRRISNPGARFGEYDTFIDKSPCYAGWTFLRLKANGDFNSCLKSHRIPIGNIYQKTFASVWNNSLQQEFRKKSLSASKDGGYFKLIGNGGNEGIGCRRVCDNILFDSRLHKIIKFLF